MLHREAVEDRGWEAEQAGVQGDDGGRALPRDDQAGRDAGRAAAALLRRPAARGRAGDPAGNSAGGSAHPACRDSSARPREMGENSLGCE